MIDPSSARRDCTDDYFVMSAQTLHHRWVTMQTKSTICGIIGKSGHSEHLIPDQLSNRFRKWLSTINRNVNSTISAQTYNTSYIISAWKKTHVFLVFHKKSLFTQLGMNFGSGFPLLIRVDFIPSYSNMVINSHSKAYLFHVWRVKVCTYILERLLCRCSQFSFCHLLFSSYGDQFLTDTSQVICRHSQAHITSKMIIALIRAPV